MELTRQHVKNAILNELNRLVQKFEEEYEPLNLAEVPVEFYFGGRAAGKASFHNGNFKLHYNMLTAKDHLEEFLKTTVPHELAHIIVFKRYHTKERYQGFYPKAHGKEWVEACVQLTGAPLKRCHTMTVVKTKRTRWYQYRSPTTGTCTYHARRYRSVRNKHTGEVYVATNKAVVAYNRPKNHV